MKPFFVVLFVATAVVAQTPVRYEISFPNAAHHEAEVRATFSDVTQPILEVVMSRSSPGRYALHEFAKNVYNFRAADANGQALTVSRPDPYGWNVSGHKGTVVVSYTLFGDRVDGTYDAIDSTHAHLNMPATFVWAHGMAKRPATFRFAVPEGSKWEIATQLAQDSDGMYRSPNVDMMMDSPVEISVHAWETWKVGDSPFRMSLHHTGTAEEAKAYARMVQAVVTESEGVFGAFPKYDSGNYTFLIDYLPYASGDGMEHRGSTIISGTGNLKMNAAQQIATVSHEFFHSWNVERIRPKALEPFDFERANMSGELWFAEGFTNYYGPLILKRASLTSDDRFAQSMSAAVNAVLTAPGREIFSVVDMARQAPFVDAATANDPGNRQNTFISYYIYGEALALGIDLDMRSRFPGKSLDDWMRQMWKEHPDVSKPYTLDDLQSALANASGSKEYAGDIFGRHIRGKEPMDYAGLLARAGFLLQKRPGGRVWFGAQQTSFSDAGMAIEGSPLRGSPAYVAGLDRGDRVVSLDGKPLKSEEELTRWLNGHKPGETAKITAETRSGKRDMDVILTESPGLEIVTFERAHKALSAEQQTMRSQWLGSKAIHPLPELHKYCPVCQRVHRFEFEYCPFDGTALGIVPAETTVSDVSERRRGRR